MLAPMSSFANSLQNIASYFSVPSIGGLYYKDKSFSAIKASNDYATLVKKLLDVMEYDVPYTLASLMEMLDLKSKETIRRHYIHPALELNLIQMTSPDKPQSRNQRYIKK